MQPLRSLATVTTIRVTIVAAMTAMAASLLAAGCGGPELTSFEPAEKMTARSPEGYSAAEYDLRTDDRALGEAKVWSDGAFRKEIRGLDRTVVHVGFLIESHVDEPLRLDTDGMRLRSAILDQRTLEDIQPAAVEGMTTVQPQGRQQIDVYFALPRGTGPTDVNAFQVRWQLRARALTYRQETPFLQSQAEQYAGMYFYTPFYDPFFYDPYGFPTRIVIHRYPYRHYHIVR